MSYLWHIILNWTGTSAPGNEVYNFWSGFGSDIGEVVIIGAIYQVYRKHDCHAKGCWRIGRHVVDGTPYITCKKHHPVRGNNVDVAQIHAAYHKAMTA
jgi:hypothetical protein